MNLNERLAHLEETIDRMSPVEFDAFMTACGAKKENSAEYTIKFTMAPYCEKKEFTIFPHLNGNSSHYGSVKLKLRNDEFVVGGAKGLAGAV